MAKRLEVYKCEMCGNVVEVLHGGMGQLVCCGKAMHLEAENTVDAAKEKHVPVASKTEAGVVVKVGSVAHPMTEEHQIEWIQLVDNDGVHHPRHFLKPGDTPESIFGVKNKDGWKVRSYCNLHGLWTVEI